jgi:hypothetical protein
MFKKKETLLIAAVSCVLWFFVAVPSSYSQTPTIHSVAGGGNWNDASTWVENTVPGPNDIVEINGTVTINGDAIISSLSISPGATLQNNNSPRTLTVNGDIINNGTIINYREWFPLIISVTGDLTNNGTWNNAWTDLHSNQTRTVEGNSAITSNITLYDDFTILGTPVFSGGFNFNGHTLQVASSTTLTLGSISSNGTVTGGGDVILTGSGSGSLDAGNSKLYFRGNFFGTATSSQAIFEDGSSFGDSSNNVASVINSAVTIHGTSSVQITGNVTINGSLSIESGATLQNNNSPRTLTVNGGVVNNGTITNPLWWFPLTVSITGDITNNGTWNNAETNLQSSQGKTINGIIASTITLYDNFTVLGTPVFSGDFNFNGHTINLEASSTITFNNVSGTGTINGNSRVYFRGNFAGIITSTNQAVFEDGSYFSNSPVINSAVTIEATSTVSVTSDATINGSLSISPGATLQNNNSPRTLTVNGDIINNGTIINYREWFPLIISVTGDLTNNGTWNNAWTDLHSNQTRTVEGNSAITSNITLYDDFTILGTPVFSGGFNFNGHTLQVASSTTLTLGSISSNGTVTGGGDVILTGSGSGSLDAGNSKLYFRGNFFGTATSSQAIFEDGSSFGDSSNNVASVINSAVTIHGTSSVQITGNVTINGSLSIESGATLQNNNSPRTLTVNGGVVNNGTITNPLWWFPLTVSITGDITNNGTWNNAETYASWSTVLGAANYLFDVSADNNNWPDAATTTDTVYDISSLVNSSHYWRVRADLGNGLYSPWSDIKSINGYGFIFNISGMSGRPIMATAPFNLTLQARDINGNSFPYNGSVALSASNDATVTPSTITMVNGYWSGTSSIAEFGNTVNLAATSGGGSGVSDDFTVIKKPVIIVPGILGTRLKESTTNEEVWPDVCDMIASSTDDYLQKLALGSDGWPATSSVIIPGDIIRQAACNLYIQDFYGGLFDALNTEDVNSGYVANTNLFVFPYDWRLDIAYTADNVLREKIEQIKNQTGAQEVDIVAHSLGGLVVEKYIQDYPQSSIDKFVDIATPHLGAPLTFKALTFGDDLNISTFFGLVSVLNPQTVKNISQNFPSMYEMLPSRNYFDASSTDYSAYISNAGGISGDLNYDQSIAFMATSSRNSTLLGYNDQLHENLDSFDPNDYNIKAYNIVGCGSPTIGEISNLGSKEDGSDQYDIKYINGDKTVPLESALALNNSVNTYYVNNYDHSGIPGYDGTEQLVLAMLNATSSVQFNASSYSHVSTSNSICGFSGSTVSVHCPVALNAYDEKGNHVGLDAKGNIEINIPGATYDQIGTNKFIFLPQGHNYRITGQATDVGHFNARVKTIVNGEVVKSDYYDQVPIVSASTSIELDFVNQAPSDEIKIDQTGNKTFKTKVKPNSILKGKQLLIKTQPQTSLVTQSSHSQTSLFLSSSANNGLNILKTEYSLDSGKTWNLYQKELILNKPGQYTIQYRSVDVAGNVEKTKEKVIEVK